MKFLEVKQMGAKSVLLGGSEGNSKKIFPDLELFLLFKNVPQSVFFLARRAILQELKGLGKF